MSDRLYIKNMVCDRCKMAVKAALDKNKINYRNIELGEIELSDLPEESQLEALRNTIEPLGFELIEDRAARTINQVKNAVISLVHGREESGKKMKLSAYLSDKLAKDYNTLSSLFSSMEGTTIEQYLIHQKIERVKELLEYDELSLSEIADQLGYSSVQHLSNQFKKITGTTPSHFKKADTLKRKPLDKV